MLDATLGCAGLECPWDHPSPLWNDQQPRRYRRYPAFLRCICDACWALDCAVRVSQSFRHEARACFVPMQVGSEHEVSLCGTKYVPVYVAGFAHRKGCAVKAALYWCHVGFVAPVSQNVRRHCVRILTLCQRVVGLSPPFSEYIVAAHKNLIRHRSNGNASHKLTQARKAL